MDKRVMLLQFGKEVRIQRKRKHLTQKTLAELLEVTPAYISAIELGQSSPSYFIIVKLYEILDISITRVLGRKNVQNSDNELLVNIEVLSGLLGSTPDINNYLEALSKLNSSNISLAYNILLCILGIR